MRKGQISDSFPVVIYVVIPLNEDKLWETCFTWWKYGPYKILNVDLVSMVSFCKGIGINLKGT